VPGEQQVRITLFQPNIAPTKVTVGAQAQPITLGRASDCTIPIKDRFLSRRHAEIMFDAGQWLVRDCGSVNGTMLNGARILSPMQLKPGDRISLGDSELVFDPQIDSQSRLIAVDSSSHAKSLAIPVRVATDEKEWPDRRGRERTGILASLAVQFIEDRPMAELFDFILDKVSALLEPSRTALALLGPDGKTFENVVVRSRESGDGQDLTISRTLLAEVIEERSVVSYVDTSADEKLAKADSIIGQQIRSAVCAPLVVGDAVLGVLYLDFLAMRGAVTPEDVRLVAQIAQLAAAKLETTRLREEAMLKAKIDEELRTAYRIQSRLLPATLPSIEGYVFAGVNKPCKTVSGDYYDVVVRPDGRIYFIIADVSGKGITAALVMSSLATAFDIFTRTDPSPAEIARELNTTLAPKTSPSKFATLVAGLLDPATGRVDFVNAGHVAPLVVCSDGVRQLTTTDLVVGLFPEAKYRNQSFTLDSGDSLVLFTDGITEAENEEEQELGLPRIANLLQGMHRMPAPHLVATIEREVQLHIGDVPAGDDVTLLSITRTR
jgi:sigma-B regulation protein RsbU (phosphoserine phosphatase)